jgi:hypothetical protein
MAARIALELTELLPTLVFGRRLFVPTVRLLEMLGFPIEEEP